MSKNTRLKKKQTTTMPVSASPDRNELPDVLPTSEPSMQDYHEASSLNVSNGERLASGLIGSGLLIFGIPNFLSLRGQLSSLAGLALLTRGVSGHCPLYSTLGIDTTTDGRMHHRGITDPHPFQLRQTMKTFRSPVEVYAFCCDQELLARCFTTVKQIKKIDERRTLWIFSDKAELVSFPVTVEITQQVEGDQLSWTAFPDSRYRINGTLRFKSGPLNQETEVTATLHMNPPAGILGGTLMKWFSPVTQEALNEVLHKMKQLLETGAVTTSQNRMKSDGKEATDGWKNRLKSHFHVRTMQSLTNRRIS